MNLYDAITTILCVGSALLLFFWALKHEISIMRERLRLEKAFKHEVIVTLKEIREAVTQAQDPGAGS